jgi:glycosyltransferase involved in cell wall biosynthesis
MDTENIHFDILSFKNPRLKAWAEEHNTEYFEFNISPYKQRKEYKAFLKDVFSRDYDVIHYHLSSISELSIFRYAKKKGRRVIVHSHNTFTDVPSRLRRLVFGNLHKVIRIIANRYSDVKCACSVPAAKWMFGSKGKDAIIMNNAIDVEQFVFNEEFRQELRTRYGINTEYVIGHVGRFSVQKNQSFLLESFKKLVEIRSDCTLVLIGNGELVNSVKQKAKDLGISEKVVFIDFQEDIYKYYSLFDLFVMPSLFEGLPITLVESQANGLISLVSDAVTKESNLTGLVEFYSLENGFEMWAKKINEKLECCKRVDAFHKLSVKGFSIKGQAKAISDLYFN